MLRLAAFTGEREYEQRALGVFRLLHQAAGRHPQAFGHLLQAMHFHFAPPREVALVGDDVEPLARVVRSSFRPTVVTPAMRPGDPEAPRRSRCSRAASRSTAEPAAYVCENFACRLPVTEPEELERQLELADAPPSPRLTAYRIGRYRSISHCESWVR